MSEHLSRKDYIVGPVDIVKARRLVTLHHYARGASNTAVYLHGLYRAGNFRECLGVAWWIPPTRAAAEATWDGPWQSVIALSRLVCVPGLPTNAASFLIGQSIRMIRRDGRFRCLVTYADGYRGHTGAIYRATNWEYLGEMPGAPTWLDGDGRMVAKKSTRTRTTSEMEAIGCRNIGCFPKHKFRIILPAPRRIEASAQLLLFEDAA